jgi:hypothetical protein
MTLKTAVIGLAIAGTAATQTGHAMSTTSAQANAAFTELKTLVGEWEADLGTQKARLSYELIAAGSALLERETADNRPTMVTLYHRDGDRLVLTHYCMAGNQPRMQARPFDAASHELVFDFDGASNLVSPAAGHMHSTKIRFVDERHIETEWQFYEKGQPTMNERARYTRVHEGARGVSR